MRPQTRPPRQAFSLRVRARHSTALLALAGIAAFAPVLDAAHAAPIAPSEAGLPAPAAAPDSPPAPVSASAAPASAAPAESDLVRFAAEKVTYDRDGDVATAIGNVVMRRDRRSLRADTVTWNRKTGAIAADGNIRFVDEDGD
eukprot:gene31038-39959_t